MAKTNNQVMNAQHVSTPWDSWYIFCVSHDALRRQFLGPSFTNKP